MQYLKLYWKYFSMLYCSKDILSPQEAILVKSCKVWGFNFFFSWVFFFLFNLCLCFHLFVWFLSPVLPPPNVCLQWWSFVFKQVKENFILSWIQCLWNSSDWQHWKLKLSFCPLNGYSVSSSSSASFTPLPHQIAANPDLERPLARDKRLVQSPCSLSLYCGW